MQAFELALNLWKMVGEPTDLEPGFRDPTTGALNYDWLFNTQSPGGAELFALINRAHLRLCAWKLRNGRLLRFRELSKRVYATANTLTVTNVSTGASLSTLTYDSMSPVHVEMYITVSNQTRLVISYGAGLITVDRPFSAAIVSATGVIFTRIVGLRLTGDSNIPYDPWFIEMTNNQKITAIYNVQNVTLGGQIVQPRPRTTRFYDQQQTQGVPGMWEHTAEGLEFDIAPMTGTVFQIDYFAEARALTGWGDEPDIPEAWHDIVWMIGAWIRLKNDKSINEARALYADIQEYLSGLVQEREHEFDKTDTRLRFRR